MHTSIAQLEHKITKNISPVEVFSSRSQFDTVFFLLATFAIAPISIKPFLEQTVIRFGFFVWWHSSLFLVHFAVDVNVNASLFIFLHYAHIEGLTFPIKWWISELEWNNTTLSREKKKCSFHGSLTINQLFCAIGIPSFFARVIFSFARILLVLFSRWWFRVCVIGIFMLAFSFSKSIDDVLVLSTRKCT